ncbi:MAG: ribbon-helix-helix domain-containing protein [Anaerolineae bacterium]
MITKRVEVSITLEASTIAKLQRAARATGCTEEVIIEQAIARYFGETTATQDGWAGAKQRGDWEHLVEDWFVGQVHDAAD